MNFNRSYTYNTPGLEEENRFLKQNVETLQLELQKFQNAPLLACELKDIIDGKGLIRLPNGNEFCVEISKKCEGVVPGDTVLAEQHNLTVVSKIKGTRKFDVEKFIIMQKPEVSWEEIGGLKEQEQEIREVIELPLTKPHLFKQIGIDPPKGVLLYGEPGTGKTLLAKAVAKSTNSTFIEIVASEIVQKFIGEGAKLVKEIFDIAREKAPTVIFIDELDAIAAVRMDLGTSGEREVQRTFMQLLSEIDGFNSLDNVKIIAATNRRDILDPAIIRPGRLDRQVYVPLPNMEGRTEILKIHTSRMQLNGVDIGEIASMTEGMSGAQLKSTVTEAGYFAIRKSKKKVGREEFLMAIDKVKKDEEEQQENIFG